MVGVEQPEMLLEADRAAVLALVADVVVATGLRPLPDQLWLALEPDRHVSETLHFLVRDGRGDVAGYAQVAAGHATRVMSVVTADPDDVDTTAALVHHALESVRMAGGEAVSWWVTAPHPASAVVAARFDLAETRELLQLRIVLPLPGPRADLPVRSFVVGTDESAWLATNNAAFSWHPEQGGWTANDIEQRERAPWFDADGFLIHERDGRIAGFCWTKVHDTEPPIGEIYVIAVHPDFHGHGLGRALTARGLDHLARAGVETGMLFVDGANDAARRLYESMGFTHHHTDRAYTVVVPR